MIFPTISLRIERWKFNKDYGIYVSTLGNFKDRYKRRLPFKLKDGYCYVKTETANWKSAHRLVMLTWRPIPNAEELTVDHLNHNKRDNSLNNLEWVTKEENLRRAKEDANLIIQKDGNTYQVVENIYSKPKKSKVLSIFSTQISVKEYRKHLMGFEVNGVKCLTVDDIYEVAREHCNVPEAELMGKIKNIVTRYETRHNVCPTGLKLKDGFIIQPIFDKLMIVK